MKYVDKLKCLVLEKYVQTQLLRRVQGAIVMKYKILLVLFVWAVDSNV